MDVGGTGGGSRCRGGRGTEANPNPGAANGGRPDSQAEELIRSPPCPQGIHGVVLRIEMKFRRLKDEREEGDGVI